MNKIRRVDGLKDLIEQARACFDKRDIVGLNRVDDKVLEILHAAVDSHDSRINAFSMMVWIGDAHDFLAKGDNNDRYAFKYDDIINEYDKWFN